DARPLEPSGRLRERILASVRETPEPRSATAVDQSRDSVSRPADDPKVLRFERPRKRVWISLGPVGAIAATFVCAVLIMLVLVLWQQNRTMLREWGPMPHELQAAMDELNHQRDVVAMLTSPDAHMAKLSGTNMAPGAHA